MNSRSKFASWRWIYNNYSVIGLVAGLVVLNMHKLLGTKLLLLQLAK